MIEENLQLLVMRDWARSQLVHGLNYYGCHNWRTERYNHIYTPQILIEQILQTNEEEFFIKFPVALINMLEKEIELIWESHKWKSFLYPHKWNKTFSVLLAVSYSIYHFFHVSKRYLNRTKKILEKLGKDNAFLCHYRNLFCKTSHISLNGTLINITEWKDFFSTTANQFAYGDKEDELGKGKEDLQKVREENRQLNAKLCLAEILTSRQIAIFDRYIKKQQLSKCERQYFHHFKKRLKPVANRTLHRMARQLFKYPQDYGEGGENPNYNYYIQNFA